MAKHKSKSSDATHALVVEASRSMYEMLEALVTTGMFGPTVETAAQRIMEQWMFDNAVSIEVGRRQQ